MGRKIVSISIDEYLLLEVDRVAGKYGLHRSEFISEVLRDYLSDRERWEAIAENKLLKKENQRLKEQISRLEKIISMNKYKLEPEPVIVNELEL